MKIQVAITTIIIIITYQNIIVILKIKDKYITQRLHFLVMRKEIVKKLQNYKKTTIKNQNKMVNNNNKKTMKKFKTKMNKS